MIRLLGALAFVFALWSAPASAATMLDCYNSSSGFATTQPCPGNKTTTTASVVITTGGTFQTILAASTNKSSLTIQNNNASDSCWIQLGSSQSITEGHAIELLAGQAYTRYFPYVPADAISGTCASNSDTMYVDYQN
jgi:hypothetical protein